MIYLHVSYDQKDHAKSLGAKWDAQKKKWYAPDESFTELIEAYMSSSSLTTSQKSVRINKMPYGGGDAAATATATPAAPSKSKVSIHKANHPTTSRQQQHPQYCFEDDD